MANAIRYEPEDVSAALKRLGVPLEILQEAVQAGYLGRISRTSNDAPNAGGFYQWNDTLRSLRENMVREGWHREDAGNWPTTVHADNKLAIAVSSGNELTGNPRATPSTKRAKGARTAQAVNCNRNQLWMPGFEPTVPETDENRPTWLLMFFADDNELRAELSLPINMDDEGHVSGWRERIILPALTLDPEVRVRIPEPDFGPDIEIKIAKKAR